MRIISIRAPPSIKLLLLKVAVVVTVHPGITVYSRITVHPGSDNRDMGMYLLDSRKAP